MSCKMVSSWHSTVLKSSRDYRKKCQGPQRPDVEQNVHLKTDTLKRDTHLTPSYTAVTTTASGHPSFASASYIGSCNDSEPGDTVAALSLESCQPRPPCRGFPAHLHSRTGQINIGIRGRAKRR